MKRGKVKRAQSNLVLRVAFGMPVDARWQATLIGRSGIWDVHKRGAELGGMLRTGVEDTFYRPNGAKTRSNGELIRALADCANTEGRDVASPRKARAMPGLRAT